MSARPRLLDLFCGAGGCSVGYARAGFYVIGVDIEPQPNYCGDEFHQADALSVLQDCRGWFATGGDHEVFDPVYKESYVVGGVLHKIDAIHASPPCQAHTTMSNRWRGAGGKADEHFDLIAATRELLEQTGLPWVIENVPGARGMMRSPVLLDGSMFGLGVLRPRLFESNVLLHAPQEPRVKVADPVGVYGKAHDGRRLFTRADGSEQRAASSLEEAREAMGIDWMDWRELAEAIPPSFTEWIGTQLIQACAPRYLTRKKQAK